MPALISAWAEARNTASGCVSSARTLVTLTINKATLVVTADNQTKVYGTANPPLTFQYSGWVNGVEAIDIAPTISTTVDGTTAVGSYPGSITLTGGSDNNYTFNFVAGNFQVTVAVLTITADNQNKTYGQTFTFTGSEFTTAGLANSDAVNTVTLTSIGTPATATIGTYPIVASAAVGTGLSNYTINYTNWYTNCYV